jgi:hypothetical protein
MNPKIRTLTLRRWTGEGEGHSPGAPLAITDTAIRREPRRRVGRDTAAPARWRAERGTSSRHCTSSGQGAQTRAHRAPTRGRSTELRSTHWGAQAPVRGPTAATSSSEPPWAVAAAARLQAMLRAVERRAEKKCKEGCWGAGSALAETPAVLPLDGADSHHGRRRCGRCSWREKGGRRSK